MTEAPASLVLDDSDFLSIVAEQRRQSIGFDDASNSSDLSEDRVKALEYYKGEMADLQVIATRSSATSTDVSDGVETILPDLADIFTGGEDVATFRAVGEEDEAAAEQETEYVRHVVFQENDGFMTIYTAIKDALLQRLGVVKFWWEGADETLEERFTGKTAIELQLAREAEEQGGPAVEEIEEVAPESVIALPTYNFITRQTRNKGRARVMAVPPEDFAVAQDTVSLRDAAYCAMKSRPRAQDLIADGYDPDLIGELPAYSRIGADDTTAQARDVAGEYSAGGSTESSAYAGLRVVEIVEHYVRVDADGDGKPELWKVCTGADEATLLSKERVDRIPFGVITPYPVAHRLIGRSLADLLMEIQRIRTSLLRMLLDSGWFALNQRHEVSDVDSNAFTMSDLLRNAPNVPVRSKTGTAVRPLASPGLGFDAITAMEQIAVLGEQRSGVQRNMQGLTPDTLHDTKGGMLAMLANAQKRIRLVARIFAETGIKDLYLGVHALIRTNATAQARARLRNGWAEVDPTQWAERNDMVVEIGLGSGGREQDLMALNMLRQVMAEVVQLQGGANGPYAKPAHIAKLLNALPRRLGLKGSYFAGAEEVEAALAEQGRAPPPDPKLIEAQQRAQLDAAKAQNAHQLDVMKAEGSAALAREEMQARLALDAQRQASELALKERTITAELDLKERQLVAELAMKERAAMIGAPPVAGFGSEVSVGGEPG